VVIVISSLAQWHSQCGYVSASVRAAESKQFEHCFEQWVNQLVQELGIQVIAIDGKNLRVPMTESLALRHCILSRGRRNIGWCWHRAKCRISRMKLQPSLPYWNCLTLKAVLSPLMPWAPKTIAAQIRAQADYILCLKANHPTLFQQIDTWFETARAEGPPRTHRKRHHTNP